MGERLAKWTEWSAGVQINNKEFTANDPEYGVAMSAFYAGYDAHAQAVSLPDRETRERAAFALYGLRYPESNAESFETVGLPIVLACREMVDAVLAALSTQPAAGEDEWEQAKWHELKADDQETGAPEGDTIRLAWENGTVLVGRLTVPSVGAGHHQVCRMQTVFGGDTFVFPHGAMLTRRVREVQPEPAPELAELFPGTLAALDQLSIRPEVQS